MTMGIGYCLSASHSHMFQLSHMEISQWNKKQLVVAIVVVVIGIHLADAVGWLHTC